MERSPRGSLLGGSLPFDPEGNAIPLTLAALVEREGTAATLAFWYVRFEPPGSFKASVFNVAGESSLSNESMSM